MLFESYELLFYRLLSRRMNLSDSDMSIYRRLKKGHAGELQVANSLCEHKVSPQYITDLWLPSNVQIDGVIVSHEAIYLLEVKNYSGHFIYQGFHSLLNGYPLGSDIVDQINRAAYHLQQYLSHQPTKIPPIRPLVIFTDPTIILENQPNNFLTWPQWIDCLASIHPDTVDTAVVRYLTQTSGQNPHRPRALTVYEESSLKRGFLCPHCGQSHAGFSRFKYRCLNCGWTEQKSLTHLRSIYEYAILHPEQPISKSDLVDFMGPLASPDVISRLMNGYLTPVCKGRYAKYMTQSPHHAYQALQQGNLAMRSRIRDKKRRPPK